MLRAGTCGELMGQPYVMRVVVGAAPGASSKEASRPHPGETLPWLGISHAPHLSQASPTLAELEEETRRGVQTTGLVKHQP